MHQLILENFDHHLHTSCWCRTSFYSSSGTPSTPLCDAEGDSTALTALPAQPAHLLVLQRVILQLLQLSIAACTSLSDAEGDSTALKTPRAQPTHLLVLWKLILQLLQLFQRNLHTSLCYRSWFYSSFYSSSSSPCTPLPDTQAESTTPTDLRVQPPWLLEKCPFARAIYSSSCMLPWLFGTLIHTSLPASFTAALPSTHMFPEQTEDVATGQVAGMVITLSLLSSSWHDS
jgi:hypothetical protein